MKNLKLKLIRQKIDKLDDKLLNLIKIRTNLVTGVLILILNSSFND